MTPDEQLDLFYEASAWLVGEFVKAERANDAKRLREIRARNLQLSRELTTFLEHYRC